MKPQPSRRPTTQSKFQKGRPGEKDKRGGGLMLACCYQLHVTETDYLSVVRDVQAFLDEDVGEEELDA